MPTQLELDIVFMKCAQAIACLSKCKHYKVGCIIVKDNRPISTGYNGSISGFDHCCDLHFDNKDDHHKFSDKFTIHAEQNAILFAAKHGIMIDDCTIYTTLQPCHQCLKMICQCNFKRIVYLQKYDKCSYDEDVERMLKISNVQLEHFQSSIIH